jgi:hypothetical protein
MSPFDPGCFKTIFEQIWRNIGSRCDTQAQQSYDITIRSIQFLRESAFFKRFCAA